MKVEDGILNHEHSSHKANGPRLTEVLDDDDFIPELRQKNELLIK